MSFLPRPARGMKVLPPRVHIPPPPPPPTSTSSPTPPSTPTSTPGPTRPPGPTPTPPPGPTPPPHKVPDGGSTFSLFAFAIMALLAINEIGYLVPAFTRVQTRR